MARLYSAEGFPKQVSILLRELYSYSGTRQSG